jgi:hypothetical protein
MLHLLDYALQYHHTHHDAGDEATIRYDRFIFCSGNGHILMM